jgi:hypothetical protein
MLNRWNPARGREKSRLRKAFFFEKKNQKTFAYFGVGE